MYLYNTTAADLGITIEPSLAIHPAFVIAFCVLGVVGAIGYLFESYN